VAPNFKVKENSMKSEETEKKAAKPTQDSDSAMEREIKDSISRSMGSKIQGLSVCVKSGVVTLEGQVDDPTLIAGITATAERMKGVTSIENKVTVAPVKKDLGVKAAPIATPEKKKETGHGSISGGPGCG
jgi:osmotically-inducible protein OsmY